MPSGLSSSGGAGDQAEQHVSDVRDRRIGEQALGVGLRERGEVGAGHGRDGDEDQQRQPDRAHGHESDEQDAEQHGPSGGLDGDGHESGDAGGRAFVGVGRPLVEGDGGDLEEQAGERGEQRDDRRPACIAVSAKRRATSLVNDAQVRAAGQAVEQRKSVGEDAGRKCAKQEIFQRGFVGAAIAAQESDQHVSGDRHQFEADEDEDDVEAGGHAHHAGDREQHQRVVFAVIFVLGLEIAHRHQDGDRPLPRGRDRRSKGRSDRRAWCASCRAIPGTLLASSQS